VVGLVAALKARGRGARFREGPVPSSYIPHDEVVYLRGGEMTKVLVDVDDDALDEASKLLGTSTKKAPRLGSACVIHKLTFIIVN